MAVEVKRMILRLLVEVALRIREPVEVIDNGLVGVGVKVMEVVCNELGVGVMVMVVGVGVMACTLHTVLVVVVVEVAQYMEEGMVVVVSELEEVGNKQEVVVVVEISMDKLVEEVNVVGVVENVQEVAVNGVAVAGSYSSKELVEVGKTMEVVEGVNLVVEEVETSHSILVKVVEEMVEVVMDK